MPYDPVGVEDLARLRELSMARDNIAHKLLSLELEKIAILAAGRRVDEEHDALLRRIMTDRGIAPSDAIDINPRTGEIAVESSRESQPKPDPTPAQS